MAFEDNSLTVDCMHVQDTQKDMIRQTPSPIVPLVKYTIIK